MVNKINRDKILNKSINLLVINLYSRNFEIPNVFERKFNQNHLSKYETKCHIHKKSEIFNIFFPKIQDLFLSKFPLFSLKISSQLKFPPILTGWMAAF